VTVLSVVLSVRFIEGLVLFPDQTVDFVLAPKSLVLGRELQFLSSDVFSDFLPLSKLLYAPVEVWRLSDRVLNRLESFLLRAKLRLNLHLLIL